MHKRLVFLMVILLSAQIFMPVSGATSDIEWYSYEDGLEAARIQDKPVMIYFGAGWCSYCIKMKEEVFPDQRVIDASSNMIFIEEDTDVDTTVANMYGVTGLPTMIFLTPQGVEQFRRTGFRDVQQLTDDISRSLQMYHGESIDWVSYEDGRAEAKSTGKPLLLYFRDDTCAQCDRMERETFSKTSIIELSNEFVMVKIEAPSRPSLTQKYSVESYPEIVFTDHDGTELGRSQGFTDSDQLYNEMESILDVDETTEESTPFFSTAVLLLTLLASVPIYGKVIYTKK
ncbi:MAG: thioredoxin family protein [Thermoplasmata archaeon]